MFRKKVLLITVAFGASLLFSFAAFAQTAGVGGRVMLKKADNTTVPVDGAVVDIFRIDQKGVSLSDKTNKKGEFSFVSVPLGGVYICVVSGVGIGPALSSNLKPGEYNITIDVSEGDGKRLTEEEVKQIINNSISQGGELTEDQKKSNAERAKLEAEFAAKKEKILKADQAVNVALTSGVAAFEAGNKENSAKNYDAAIGHFDTAIIRFEDAYQANPEYVGSAPIMLNNKALSLTKRALARYNKTVISKDPALKVELKPFVEKDFENAVASYYMAWNIGEKASPEEIAKIQKAFDDRKLQTLIGANETVGLMVRTEFASESQKDAARTLVHKYIAAEKDAKKREAAQLDIGLYFNRIFDFEGAITEFRKFFEMAPNNTEGIGLLGLALYTVTYEQDDTVRKQEALNYMQHYLDTAAKDDKLRDGIEGAVTDLKSQKLKPQKITAKN